MSLLATSSPNISQEFLLKADKAFPRVDIIPNVTTLDEIMHNAGERKVIEWLRHQASGSIITGKV